jgi:hypothetical protein
MTPFHFEQVRASHQAIGVPTISRMIVVVVASLSVSQTAAKSTSPSTREFPQKP